MINDELLVLQSLDNQRFIELKMEVEQFQIWHDPLSITHKSKTPN
jgi:hypothetical protein